LTHEEEMALREYAAGRACTQAVVDALGPMSLWSMSAFNEEIRKAVEAEREACAKLSQTLPNPYKHCQISSHAYDTAVVDYSRAIRARGKAPYESGIGHMFGDKR